MPKLVQLYIKHTAIGFGIAAVFVAILLWFDVQNLWHLVTHSGSGLLAVFLLWFMNGIVFAGVQFAWAVMNLAEKPDRDGGGTPLLEELQPVHVRSDETRADRRSSRF